LGIGKKRFQGQVEELVFGNVEFQLHVEYTIGNSREVVMCESRSYKEHYTDKAF
jgi:hypothetical protein